MAQQITHHTVARDLADLCGILGGVPVGGYVAFVNEAGEARQFAKGYNFRFEPAGSYFVPIQPLTVSELAKVLMARAQKFGIAQSPDSAISTWAKAYTFTEELSAGA